MLSTLIESRPSRSRSRTAAIASASLHAVLIIGAVYATAAEASAERRPEPIARIHWVPTSVQRSTDRAASRAGARNAALSHRIPPAPRVLLDLSARAPNIEMPMPDIGDDRFSDGLDSGTALSARSGSGGGIDEQQLYESTDVDISVAPLRGNPTPQYPPALRAAGTEGEVAVQFVVDQAGVPQISTLKILTATNDLFAQSVKRALPGMRFTPARVGGKAVAQLVRQGFVFRLDR